MDRLQWHDAVQFAVALAGVVAALRADSVGLAVLFAAIVLLAVRPLVRPRRRRMVALRSDLASWLDVVSSTTGESTQDVLDRSVSAYRATTGSDADA